MERHSEMNLLGEHMEDSMMLRVRDNGCDSRSGSENLEGGASGDDLELNENQRSLRSKKYHRHTPHQIQQLELSFKECPHPDEKQRADLSRRLGLESKQIKFWFQNRRTQLKTQLERHENVILRQENEKLRAENEIYKQSVSDPICNSCGTPVVPMPVSFEQQQLRIENARLKDELGRVCVLANKFLGKQMPPPSTSVMPYHNAKLDLSIGRNGYVGLPEVDPSFGAGFEYNDCFMMPSLKPPPICEPSYDRSHFVDIAFAAMDELVKKAQADSPLWIKSWNGNEVLNHEEYARTFSPAMGMRPSSFITEATRETAIVHINSVGLTEILMDMNRFAETFSTMVSRALTTDVIANSHNATKNGVLQVMIAEFQVLSPLVPLRQVKFLRFCKQHTDTLWAVVDVSIDTNPDAPAYCRRFPSGCLIQEMPNGYCKVTWVEHTEYDESAVHQLYRLVISSGRGFGAQRWLLTLRRYCECVSMLVSPAMPEEDQTVSLGGRRSTLKLAHRMVDLFCSSICASSLRKWEKLQLGNMNGDTRILARKSFNEPGEPSGIVLCASTSAWLQISRQKLFDFMRDEKSRTEWDILSKGGLMQEMVHVAKGHDRGNYVSILHCSATDDNGNSNMFLLQETWSDASGSLLVYAPVDVQGITLVMNGGDQASVALLPSGFIIDDSFEHGGPMTCNGVTIKRDGERGDEGGSLLTVGFQILVNSPPSGKLTMDSVETLNNLLCSTFQRIKTALNLS